MAINRQGLIKLCSINISGFSKRSKLTLDKYVESEGFDIVTVQETGTCDRTKLKLSNMNCITDRNNARNRGSVLYLKDKYSLAALDQISAISKDIDSSWGLVIINNSRYIVGTVYCKLNYDPAVDEIIAMLNKAKSISKQLKVKGTILMGDMNARHELWGDNTNNKYGLNLIKKLNFSEYSIISSNTPTFLTDTGSSVIDLIIVSNNLTDKIEKPKTDEEVELFSGAPFRGHLPIITNISGLSPTNQVRKEKTSLESVDWTAWSSDLETELNSYEHDINNGEDEKHLLDVLDTKIDKVTTVHAKKKVITNHSKPYWTPRLSRLSQELREKRKKYKQRNTDRNKLLLDQAKTQFDEARKEECQEFILSKTKNMNSAEAAKFWKEFKKLFSPKKDCKVDPLNDGNGGFITDNSDMEKELFSTFFEAKHLQKENFDEEFCQEVHSIYEDIINDRHIYDDQDDMLNSVITIEEIRKAIKNYDGNGKSADNHEFHPVMFKNFGPKALQLLHKVMNLCLAHANWLWQDSEIIFLKKEGKDSYANPGAYRPISITSYLGKLFEKIQATRLEAHYVNKGMLDPDQEGFTKSKNTGRYLNRLNLSVMSDKKQGKTSICLFVDLEKAFDSTWKEGLIVKLAKDGVKGNFLKLLISFLDKRTVQLKVNGVVGPIRQCTDVGLPQGSALSPILFKIFLMDLAGELSEKSNVDIFKFADDGSIKATGETTASCLQTFEEILETVHKWSQKWRMVINCNRNKSEVIAFATAENNRDLVPKTFKIGDKEIHRVSKTKVLGLVMDEDLTYLEHSKEVSNKLISKWAMICQYCNKNWGFSQRVLTQLIRTLILSTMFYVGHIWINRRTMKDINMLWYKIIKTTIGAVFNIRLSIGEVILGLAPLHTVNTINQIKHYLKLNIRKMEEDRLKEFIQSCLTDDSRMPVELYTSMRKVFKYLKWKVQHYPDTFEQDDIDIISYTRMEKYFELSCLSCKYTKGMMKKYTEHLWSQSITFEFQAEGHTYHPKPRCDPLQIPKQVSRQQEVQLMSLFYTNNLLNGFLYSYNSQKFPSPLCHCGQSIQTNYHIGLGCSLVNNANTSELVEVLKTVLGENEVVPENYYLFLNASKNQKVINLLLKNIELHSDHLRTEIEL